MRERTHFEMICDRAGAAIMGRAGARRHEPGEVAMWIFRRYRSKYGMLSTAVRLGVTCP